MQIGFTFLVLADQSSPGKRVVEHVFVCCLIIFLSLIYHLFVKASKMTVTKVSVQDQQGSESAYSEMGGHLMPAFVLGSPVLYIE